MEKDMVMQYLCLFWASDNSQYGNSCIAREKTDFPDPANYLLAPRPPCRSFCVQVLFLNKCNDVTFLCPQSFVI